jgi:hypothetical protein
MNKLLSSLLLVFCVSCHANESLILSSETSIDYSHPKVISHGGNLLIMKYDNWYFSHELIDPIKLYPSIDLTGLEKDFIKSLFIPSIRESFPKWLGELSLEQASIFGITENKSVHKKFDNIEYYSIFDSNGKTGNIFIIEANQVHHLSFSGEIEQYTKLINSIKER